MTPERWQKVDEIFQAAVELKPAERATFLDSSCGNDEGLRREVESLLSCDEEGLSIIDEPAYQVAAGLLVNENPRLTEGQQIGHYEIAGLIGKGGMGEVYAAKDKRLKRRIALKLLPAEYTRHKDRLRRFQQEAQAASALNHPNILTIHELGEVDGQQFIATEFVEGETLRERMRRDRLSLPKTLDIVTQVAGALSAAHRAGIVHRDIKPENIMLRPDGYVKVLDFGLAKLTEQYETAGEVQFPDRIDVSSGLVMGTVKYMSPEQARGQPVDARSDIFSLGVVLYEMLNGDAPFKGESASDVINSILKHQPTQLRERLPDAPEELQRIISKALAKDKSRRYPTVEDMLTALDSLRQREGLGPRPRTIVPRADGRERSTEILGQRTAPSIEYLVSGIKQHKTTAGLILTALAVVVVVGVTFGLKRFGNHLRAPSAGMKITRILGTDKASSVAISPNGEYIAYAEMNSTGKPNAKQSLWVLHVATNTLVQILPPSNIEILGGLTYSPDGGSLFYVTNDALYKIPASGGEAVRVLADVGAFSLSPDGRSVAFERAHSEETVIMVANLDGSGEHLLAKRTRPESIGGPAWSPDGRLIACTTGVVAKNGQASIIAFDVATGEERTITDHKWDEFGGRLMWLPDGSGLVVSAGQIWQISYPSGEARQVTSDPNYGYSDLSLTADGKSLVALQGGWRSAVWLLPNGDPDGAMPITSDLMDDLRAIAWTPDGRILYASNAGNNRNIWIMNGDGRNPKQLTTIGENLQARASADGRYIVVSSNRGDAGGYNLWRMDIDGSNPVQLTHGNGGAGQPVCSPDGQWVVYSTGGPNTGALKKTLWKVSIDGGEPVPLTNNKPSAFPAISPDGSLIACWYQENPGEPMKMALIPIAGGPPVKILDARMPQSLSPIRWKPDGKFISYVDTKPFVGNIWNQPVDGGSPQQLTQFTTELIGGFDWSRDGNLICARRHSTQDVIMITDFR